MKNNHQNHGCHQGHSGHNHSQHITEYQRRFWVALIFTFPVLLLSRTIQGFFNFQISIPFQKEILLGLAGIIYFYGGWPFLRDLVSEVRQKKPGMMTLIGMAISVAFLYSAASVLFLKGEDFFWELATLIDIMLLGHWIEAKSVLGASSALEELAKLLPSRAHLIKNGQIKDIPVSQLKVNDIVLIKPGEKIPSDGKIIKGESDVNEALLTGESKPINKKINDKVIGGSLNGSQSLQIEIEKTGQETYLAQVTKLVQEAQAKKSKTQDLADRAAALLFYLAVSAGIITFLVWYFLGNPSGAVTRAVTVLVIACPHALGFAIPLVVSIATSLSAKNGILPRNRSAFEKLKDIEAVVFDKTGTLTEGKFGVTDFTTNIDEAKFLQIAAAVDSHSEHIVAQSIVNFVKLRGLKISEVENFKKISGFGAYGEVSGKKVYIGNPTLFEVKNIPLKDKKIKKLLLGGQNTVLVSLEGEIVGGFNLEDKIKKESIGAVKSLRRAGVKVYMITGDRPEVAKRVARKLKIDDYFAQVLPDKKAEKIELLKKEGLKVAMVGDGVNDAPALASADIGIAIGAGTDVALEAADVILVRNNPEDVAKSFDLSRKIYRKMVQNLWWAAGYNIVAIPLAAGILANFGIIINPAIGAILMSLSTIIVAINAQTLRRYRFKRS